MIKLIRQLLSKYYNKTLESFCVRVLYFFNTINTYFLVAGLLAFLVVMPDDFSIFPFLLTLVVIAPAILYSDFHPTFFILAAPGLILYCILSPDGWGILGGALLINLIIYYVILTCFMSIPESIVARSRCQVILRKFVNSAITIAPTTVSLSISVSFSLMLTVALTASPNLFRSPGWGELLLWLGVISGAVLARFLRPRTFISKFFMPEPLSAPYDRVVILNIDGCRMDVLAQEKLPTVQGAIRSGSSLPGGLTTVYRALTNPAFASILTGAPPQTHGIKDNNFGQSIGVEGLPDIVPTILYGSMHVAHFSKKSWECNIVSLPEHSVYKSDAVVQAQLLHDLKNRDDTRLFVMDYSEADFLAHAFGSTSREYRSGLRNIDDKINEIMRFVESDTDHRTAVIICSDHGVVAIDHSYLLFDAEKYVPFIVNGPGIRKNFTMNGLGSIMDICCTIAYLLGVRYPEHASGRVFSEIVEAVDSETEHDRLIQEVNTVYYDCVSGEYDARHPEVVEGDLSWWVEQFTTLSRTTPSPLRVLDFGCGTGFVGKALAKAGLPVQKLVCYDISPGMVEKARQELAPLWNEPTPTYTTTFEDLLGSEFDVICVNSVLHHVHDPEAVAQDIANLLAEGGFILGAHEPNGEFFDSPLSRGLAALYKRLGQGISLPEQITLDFNTKFKQRNSWAPQLRADAILQTVENHSPVEQDLQVVPKGLGFKRTLVSDFYPGMKTVLMETYTTAFIRKVFTHRPGLRRFLSGLFALLFPSGNLIRYVARKPGPRPPS